MRGLAGKIVSAMIMLSLILVTGCTNQEPIAELPAPEVYQPADPAGEDSVAIPVPPGTATTLTAPLVDRGAFCVQARSNVEGRALWCRNRNADDPWVAQFLLDREGRLVWAWIPVPSPAPDSAEPYQPERMAELASGSLGTVWPDSGRRIAEEIQRYERDRRDRADRGISSEGAFTRAWRDDHADYTVSSLYGLIVAARDVKVERWPSDAAHYAERMSSAVGDLQQSGFECFYPPQTTCRREFNEFRVSLRGDRIVTADFVINGGESVAEVFPRGLTFLTPDVRNSIAAQIEKSRFARQDFLGIVAGTVLAINAAPIPQAGGTVPIAVRVGTPLTGTFPI